MDGVRDGWEANRCWP